MRKNKKGFTLIELLAVIVILAIIALIAMPIVLNIIERARKGAFIRSSENVLKASNLYYTNSLLDVNQPEDIRFECTKTKCLSSKLDEKGNPINLNVDGNIGEGYVLITNKGEVEFLLQNGSYCAIKYPSTKNITVKKEECNNIDITNDETAPVIDKINTVVTSNSITVTVSAYDNESGISGYAFSIDGENYTDYQTNNVYKFNNLTSDKTYKIRVRVYNGTYGKDGFEEAKAMSTKETEEIFLKTIEEPTFEITPDGWATEKTVTINYPLGYTNEYSIDNGNTFLPYTEAITFTANGNIIARITDGTNTITKTQMIEKIDRIDPTITIGKVDSTYKDITIPFSALDSDSEIKEIICKYGEDDLDKIGMIKNNICILDNIEYPKIYKYEIKVVDNALNEKTVSGTAQQELSYVTDGLMVYYDGYTEPENGKWKDLSGNGNDGTIYGAVWDTNHLIFDGVDDYITVGKIYYPNTTFEAIVNYNSSGVSQHVIADIESAGRTLYIRYTGRLVFQSYVNDVGYTNVDASVFMSEDKTSYISGTILENSQKVFFNGNLVGSIELSSCIAESTAPLAIGCNPITAERCNANSFYKGNIYAVRIYNRALTEDEIKNNYTIDKARFNIE